MRYGHPRWPWASLLSRVHASHSQVRGLRPAIIVHLRVAAYNSVGWSLPSYAAIYTTAVPPLSMDIKPPHAPRVATGVIRCAGSLFVVGGQLVDAPPGVRADENRPLTPPACVPHHSGRDLSPLPISPSQVRDEQTAAGTATGRTGQRRLLTSLEQYDATTRTWLRRADMRVPRSHPGLACVHERSLLVSGGFGAMGEAPYAHTGPLTSSEEYDPSTDTWYDRADAPTARYHFAVASEPAGHVYAAGGFGSEYGHARAAYGTERVLDTFDRYDAHAQAHAHDTRTWSASSTLLIGTTAAYEPRSSPPPVGLEQCRQALSQRGLPTCTNCALHVTWPSCLALLPCARIGMVSAPLTSPTRSRQVRPAHRCVGAQAVDAVRRVRPRPGGL